MEGDGWEDLFAVVRGSVSPVTSHPTAAAAAIDPCSSLPAPHFPCSSLLLPCSPDSRRSRTALQELEELCKPFLRQQSPALKPISSSPNAFLRLPEPRLLPQAHRSKRRKSQLKRVVCQVPAEGLSSDKWAWRKYGQKPIKGSPFPRGYYRCSSSKGCLARKQVERSKKDPNMFVITYSGEHNHPLPTHRNSLAGSTRQKSSSTSASRLVKQQSRASSSSSGSEVTEEDKKEEGAAAADEEEEEEEMEEAAVAMRELEMLEEDDGIMLLCLDGFEDPLLI